MRSIQLLAVVVELLGLASAAAAQAPASSLQALDVLARARTPVTVVESGGGEVRGTITDVSAGALVLRTGDGTRRFDAGEIASVRARQEDPLTNGALIGGAIGAGLSSLAFLDNECRDDPACYVAVAVYGGIGAVVGLGIDALTHRSVVVYAAPVVSRSTAGVRLSFSF